MPKPLILCVGHHLRGDDAVGAAVADRLRELNVPARWLLGDAADLLGAWSPADDVIVVDAVVTGATPGTLHRWNGFEVPLERLQSSASTHGFGIAEAIGLGRVLNRLPKSLTLLGIEAAQFELGAPISPAVASALDSLVKLTIEEWNACASSSAAPSKA
jgi:hydrogenase maturation protease